MTKTTFSWKNYTKPTPENLLGLSAALRRGVAIVAGTSILMDANKFVPLLILGIGWFLDELKNFFAVVVEREEKATAHFPSGDEVTLTKSTPDSNEH